MTDKVVEQAPDTIATCYPGMKVAHLQTNHHKIGMGFLKHLKHTEVDCVLVNTFTTKDGFRFEYNGFEVTNSSHQINTSRVCYTKEDALQHAQQEQELLQGNELVDELIGKLQATRDKLGLVHLTSLEQSAVKFLLEVLKSK